MRAFLDISIFSTPTSALGNITGIVELQDAPVLGQPVPWPSSAEQDSVNRLLRTDVVVNIDCKPCISGADVVVGTDGLVHDNEQEARQTIKYLEDRYGLVFCEY
jgi:hypothetical protein